MEQQDKSLNFKENTVNDEIIYLRKDITLIENNTSFSDTVTYVKFEVFYVKSFFLFWIYKNRVDANTM